MKTEKQNNGVIAATALTLICIMSASNAFALSAPADGSFAFDLYTIAVTNILKGPIGFVSGVACMVFAAIMAIRQMMLPAIAIILGGAFLLKADTIVTSLGAIVN